MFLLKRKGVFYLEYFNAEENKIKRVSTRKRIKRDALKFLVDFEKKLKSKPAVNYISIEDFKIQYTEQVKINLSAKYYKNVDLSFRLLIEQTGNIALSKLSYQLLDKFISDTYSRTKQGAITYYRILKSAFNKAIGWGYLERNPLDKIKPPKIPSNNPLFISEKELNVIINIESNKTLAEIYLFAFHTGMRISEIINLKWDNVSLTDRIIKVSNTKEFTTKGKKERIIPINEILFKVLQNRFPKVISLEKNELVFSKNGFKYSSEYISKKFKEVVRKSGLNSNIHFHDLRHSFASNLVKKGISIFIVKELLGHRDVKTTQIYSHLTIDSLKDAVKVLES